MMEYKGVLPTATGSEVRRLFGINNSHFDEMYGTERGREAIEQVAINSRDAGATIGVAPTFRVTQFRASDTGWDFRPEDRFNLSDNYSRWNRDAVHIARRVYQGALVLGTVAPTTNTSRSQDDYDYLKVGDGSDLARVQFSFQRQDPQIAVLAEAGVDGIAVEACRFRTDALAIAHSVRAHGVKLLVVSFEADELGFPDPFVPPGYTFRDMKRELQEIVGDEVEVRIGINCTGASNAKHLIEQRHPLDVIYPNQADLFRPPTAATWKRLLQLCGEADNTTFLREQVLQLVYSEIDTPLDGLKHLWLDALRSGTQVIGICCGGTPDHVRLAREAYDEFCKGHYAAT